MGYIYKITNKINKKIYIGQTTRTIAIRWKLHQYSKGCKYLHSAILKYRKENFIVELLEKIENNKLDKREIFWIKYYNTTNKKFGYNILEGGKLGRSNKFKLTKKQVENLIYLKSKGYTNIRLSLIFNINRKTIKFILERENKYKVQYIRLKDRDDIDEIIKYLKYNPTAKEVCDKFKIARNTLFKITKLIGYNFLKSSDRNKRI